MENWYVCGPTIYDSSHIGHARVYITFDIIRRIKEKQNIKINYGLNITNIDDKIINRVKESGLSFDEFISIQEMEFWNDMKSLNVLFPTFVTRVTDVIPDIIEYIQNILGKGYAYESNGSIYFNT